ncbi:MAG: DUF6754 domain-containing protein [Chloroflexota bacterium]
MDPTTQTIAFLIIMLAVVAVMIGAAVVIRQRSRARQLGIDERNVMPLRDIDAYEVIPRMVGLAVEADRPVLISTGASTIGDDRTVVALASLALAYYTTQEMAVGNTAPVLVTNQTLMVPLASDMLKRAYLSMNQPVRTNLASVRWYGTLQEQSLVYAAMLTATMAAEEVTGNLLLGNYGYEIGLVLGAAQRKGITSVAGSDDPVGQAVAYGMADSALIGEDIFSPVGYLGTGAGERGSLLAQDFLRGAIIVGILVVAAVEVAGEQVVGVLQPLLGFFGG